MSVGDCVSVKSSAGADMERLISKSQVATETELNLDQRLALVWFGLVWFGFILWHINHCRLFNAKSFLYIYKI